MEKLKDCPVCQHKNTFDATHCTYCGASLAFKTASIRNTQSILPTAQELGMTVPCEDYLPLLSPDDAALVIKQGHDPIILRNVSQTILGRAFKETEESCVDLEPMGAAAYGVSRRHAQIVRTDDKFVFEDLRSTNGTWINGQRLPAGISYPLTSGDQIWLGQFKMHICFHQPEPIPESVILLQNSSNNIAGLTPAILLEQLGPFFMALNALQKIAARCLSGGSQADLIIKRIDADDKDATYIVHLAQDPHAVHLVRKWIAPWRVAKKEGGGETAVSAEMVQLAAKLLADISPTPE
ncbi:MAG: FHA domain-containing protein [Chloroflexi bacterium]|nr:FHA domain-containing protein [Chloroflexota bacterium]